MNDPPAYDPRHVEGARLFNACDFHEAHDAWEDLWTEYQGPSRDFYKGLIQTAVCLFHFCNGNIRGARKLYHSSRKYLAPYGPQHGGVDLDKLLAEMERCCAAMLAAEGEFPEVDIDESLIPEIHLNPPA